MKSYRSVLSLSVCATVPLLFLAMVVAARSEALPKPAAAEATLSAAPLAPPAQAVPAFAALPEAPLEAEAPPDTEALAATDAARVVTVLEGGETRHMYMEEYLVGVLAAEMPASFHDEALKAQACAARTDTVYRRARAVHENGASCTDPGCCKAYLDAAARAERWGTQREEYEEKLRRAVRETDGEIVVYRGEAIFAAFHASSPGSTECSENVWIEALPYLRGVESPETEALTPGFYASASFSYPELQRLAEEAWPGIQLRGEPAHWLTDATYTESGRLQTVRFGSLTRTGGELRALLGLRSAAIRWTCGAEGVCFETAGYGHGVGLSQYGAEAMAREGSGYRDILRHYYTGTELDTLG